jgi:sialidase-1
MRAGEGATLAKQEPDLQGYGHITKDTAMRELITASALSIVACAQGLEGAELWLHPKCEKLPTAQLGPFVKLPDGALLCIDAASSRVSSNAGKTWSEPRPLFAKDQPAIKVSNERALFRTADGAIIAAFMNLAERHWDWQNALHDAPGAKLPTYVMRSLDNGRTWQDIQKLHDDWSGAVRDMIQTRDGRIVFTAMKFLHDPGRHSVLTYSSTDDGKTWKASNLIDLGGMGHHGGVTEPTLTELADGRLWMLIRTNWGEFWSAYSNDGGRFWQIMQPSGIAASSAPGLLQRLASGRLLLVWNMPLPAGKKDWPKSGGDGIWSAVPVSNHREELVIAFSADDGRSWSTPTVIAKQNGQWLAYPYVFEPNPGEIWITTMQGTVRARLQEADFLAP